MKILYTKKFKEILDQPWSSIYLGKVELRDGNVSGIRGRDIPGPMDDKIANKFLDNNIPWNTDIISLPGGGIQIFFEVPKEDQSFRNEVFRYQVIMFFFRDLLNDSGDSLAFVCYENINEGKELGPDTPVIFTGMELTTRKNIITLPKLTWKCNINLSQTEVTKFLESPVGNLEVSPFLSDSGYSSKESWKAWMVDSISERTLTPWIETTYINKYGLKIY